MPHPPRPERPPTVLILGGLPTLARPLSLFLAQPGPDGTPRASFLRIVDRYSVSPPSTYLDPPFVALLRRGSPVVGEGVSEQPEGDNVEAGAASRSDSVKKGSLPVQYQQANLSLVDRHQDIYTPPSTWNGQAVDWAERGFEVVYDLTGEMGFDRPELVRPLLTLAFNNWFEQTTSDVRRHFTASDQADGSDANTKHSRSRPIPCQLCPIATPRHET